MSGWSDAERPAFLFDTASMPTKNTSCSHCDPNEKVHMVDGGWSDSG